MRTSNFHQFSDNAKLGLSTSVFVVRHDDGEVKEIFSVEGQNEAHGIISRESLSAGQFRKVCKAIRDQNPVTAKVVSGGLRISVN